MKPTHAKPGGGAPGPTASRTGPARIGRRSSLRARTPAAAQGPCRPPGTTSPGLGAPADFAQAAERRRGVAWRRRGRSRTCSEAATAPTRPLWRDRAVAVAGYRKHAHRRHEHRECRASCVLRLMLSRPRRIRRSTSGHESEPTAFARPTGRTSSQIACTHRFRAYGGCPEHAGGTDAGLGSGCSASSVTHRSPHWRRG